MGIGESAGKRNETWQCPNSNSVKFDPEKSAKSAVSLSKRYMGMELCLVDLSDSYVTNCYNVSENHWESTMTFGGQYIRVSSQMG